MADRGNDLCWRIMIPVAAMGSALLLAFALTKFSIEPLAFGIMVAIGIALAALDRATGFDARAVIRFVNDYPTLAGVKP